MVNDMSYKSTVTKHTVLIIVGAVCGILLAAGTSYALFFQSNMNTNNQVVKTGKLEITYGDQSSSISLTSLSPIADSEVLNDDRYSSNVKIENTGSLPASYSLKLAKDIEALESDGYSASEFVDLDYVRVAAYVGNETLLEPTTLGRISADSDGNFVLKTGTLGTEANNKSVDVKVKIWLDENTPVTGDDSQVDKCVYFKLLVDSVVDEENTPEGQVNNVD